MSRLGIGHKVAVVVAVSASLGAFGGGRASADSLPMPVLPPFPYPSDVPTVELPGDIPTVQLPAAIPEITTPADLPPIQLPADIPPIGLPAEIPRGLL